MTHKIHPIAVHIMPEQIQFGFVGLSWCIGFADGEPCFDDDYIERSISDLIIMSAYRGSLIKLRAEGNL
jgi:hypothetical protein